MYAWGQAGMAGGMFNNPQQMAVASDGTMYVADSGNHRVQKFLPRRQRNALGTSPLVGPTRPVLQPDNRVGDPDELPPAQGLPDATSPASGAAPFATGLPTGAPTPASAPASSATPSTRVLL